MRRDPASSPVQNAHETRPPEAGASPESGATAVEYGLLVALVAGVVMAAVALVGGDVLAAFASAEAGFPG